MEKTNKTLKGVLAVVIVAFLAVCGGLFYTMNQKETAYIAAMASLQTETAQTQEAMQAQLDQARAELEQLKTELDQAKSDLDTANREIDILSNPDDPLAGMTMEEVMASLRDTSDAPGKIDMGKEIEKTTNKAAGETPAPPAGATGGQENDSQTDQGQTEYVPGIGKLTPEQQAKRDAILKKLREQGITDGSELHNGGATGDGSYDGPGINWNK